MNATSQDTEMADLVRVKDLIRRTSRGLDLSGRRFLLESCIVKWEAGLGLRNEVEGGNFENLRCSHRDKFARTSFCYVLKPSLHLFENAPSS